MAIRRVCQNNCTACKACMNICPQKCITIDGESPENTFARIDTSKCKECHLCAKACPNIAKALMKKPIHCFAGWSTDDHIRQESASGGIATALYNYFSGNGYAFAGVKMTNEFEAVYELMEPGSDPALFSNSKYVYSDTQEVYSKIANKIKNNVPVLFIGLPCQVSGLKSYLSAIRLSDKNVLTVDIICHGTTPPEWLKQYVAEQSKERNIQIDQVCFREPKYKTSAFVLSLKGQGKVKYARGPHRNDCYQIGYHCGITYRDTCYSCTYATKERIGDLTISDFAYVGSYAPCSYTNENVSCILVNTEQGLHAIEALADEKLIVIEERPLEEATGKEQQLKAPTRVPSERAVFLAEYRKLGDFSAAMKIAGKKIMLRNELKYYMHTELVKKIAARLVPRRIKKLMKGRKRT